MRQILPYQTCLQAGEGGRAIFFSTGGIFPRCRVGRFSKLIALVPQTPFLIAGTLRENICYGLDREVSDAELEEASRKACLSELVESLPDGLSLLSQRRGGGGICQEVRSRE